MAIRHQQLLDAGARTFAISIDPPERNAAMIEKLSLPFPYLSDPDRSRAITPYGVADQRDERLISRPAMVVVAPGFEEEFRFVSRDYADRLPEDEVLEAVEGLQLLPTTQPSPVLGLSQPGPRSLTPAQLRVYYRGARFAALAMGLRHRHHSGEIKDDSKAYVAEMDRYTAAMEWLEGQQTG